jgi:hypothetical protein
MLPILIRARMLGENTDYPSGTTCQARPRLALREDFSQTRFCLIKLRSMKTWSDR